MLTNELMDLIRIIKSINSLVTTFSARVRVRVKVRVKVRVR